MTKKYYSMLAGGTLTCMVTALLTMSDTFVSGIFIGEKAVAGINLVLPLYSLASFFAMLFSLGIPIHYSKAMGGFDKREADKAFGFGLLASIIVGTLMFALGFFFGRTYLEFYKADPDVFEYASEYMTLMPYIMLLMPFQNLIFTMIFTDGDEWLNFAANITEVTGNLVSSVILVKKMGTAGIAAGSLLGIVLSILVCLSHLFRKKNSLRPNLYYSKKLLVSSIHYGLTDSGAWFFLSVSSMILNKFVTDAFGSSALVLVGVINLAREIQLFFDGIGEAITPIISIYYSEQCYEGVKKIWKLAKKTCAAEGIAVAVLCFAGAGFVPDILGIKDAEIAAQAVIGVRIMAFSMPVVCFIYLWTSYCLILGKVSFNLVITALRDVLIAIPLAVAGGLLFGITGVFAGMAAAPFLALLCGFLYVRIKRGRKAYPLLLNEKEKKVKSYVFEFALRPEKIAETRDEIERVLDGFSFEKRAVIDAMLLFEESFMLIYRKNAEGRAHAECTMEVYNDRIKLVSWDDGVPFDLADKNMRIENLGAFILSRMKSREMVVSKHQIVMSFNRNMFEMKMSR